MTTTNIPDQETPEETETLRQAVGRLESALAGVRPLLGTEYVDPIGKFRDDTAAARDLIRQLVFEDLGDHAKDPIVEALHYAAKSLQQEADTVIKALTL